MDAAVLAIGDDAFDRRLVAYIVSRPDVEAGAWQEALTQRLPDFMVPRHWVVLDSMPLTSSSKIDRKQLAKIEIKRPMRTLVEPQTDTEKSLAQLWMQLLKIDRIGRDDDFFALGGHSLLATQVASRIREVFNVEVQLRALFDQSSLAALASHIDASRESASIQPVRTVSQIQSSIDAMTEEEVVAMLRAKKARLQSP